jgi:EmrB/QacA subfamily drug resistance transporter
MSSHIAAAEHAETNRWVALGLLSAAQFMVVVDFAVVNVAIPSIQRDLHFNHGNIQWVFNAYLLAYGGLLLLGGRIADQVGRRLLFMTGAGLMAVASLVAGLSSSQSQLIVARALQGTGAAVITPAALAIILSLFGEGSDRNKALGIWGALGGVGASAGVLLGGVITQGPGWQWIFYLNVPVAAAVVLVSPALLRESRIGTRSFDVAGGLSITLGLIAVVYATVRAPDLGWGSARTIGALAIGVALVVAFVVIELRSRAPLVKLSIFRLSTVAGANAVAFVLVGAFFAVLFLLTLYMQQALGYSALRTGLAFLPLAGGVVVASVIAARVVNACGVKLVMLAGILAIGAGLYFLTQVTATSGYETRLLPAFVLLAAGVGFAFVALSIAAFAGVDEDHFGVASGLYNTSNQVGGAVGVAILATVAYSHLSHLAGAPSRSALATAYADGFKAGYALIGLALVALFALVRKHHLATWKCATPYRLADTGAPQPGKE